MAGRKILTSALFQRAAIVNARRTYAAGDPVELKLTLASPGKAYYSNVVVKQVDVPTFSGHVGIMPNHVPLLGILKPGVINVYTEEGIKKFFVSSGTVTINADSTVQVLAEEAFPTEQLDADEARKELSAAQSEMSAAADDVGKAAAQVKIDTCEAILAASADK